MYFMITAAKRTKRVSFPSKSSPFQYLQITEKLIKVHDKLLISEISQNPLNIPGVIFHDMNTKQQVLRPLTSFEMPLIRFYWLQQILKLDGSEYKYPSHFLLQIILFNTESADEAHSPSNFADNFRACKKILCYCWVSSEITSAQQNLCIRLSLLKYILDQ